MYCFCPEVQALDAMLDLRSGSSFITSVSKNEKKRNLIPGLNNQFIGVSKAVHNEDVSQPTENLPMNL